MSDVYLWICVLFVYAGEVYSSGVFEVKIRSLHNKHGRTAGGRCCMGPDVDEECTATCHTFFTLCLLHYQEPVPNYPNSCTFGDNITQIVGGNNIGIGAEAEPSFVFSIPFNFKWPGKFAFILDAWHDRHGNRSTQDTSHIILRVSRAKKLKPSFYWHNDERLTHSSELKFSYRVVCNENYFGHQCDRWCKEKDNRFGHYWCTHTGKKECLKGWQGPLCDKVKCPQSCYQNNGFCDKPLNCICKSGWKGTNCQECITDVKCLRGYCDKAWECKCSKGWSGSYCNIYNNYCETYTPCFNGATCYFNDVTNYTCTCKVGFRGDNCEREYCYKGFCLHDSLCEEVGSKRVCRCQKGYSGNRCQDKSPTCGDLSCRNNGTCMRINNRWACTCLPGFQGHFCEIQQNECASDPCHNGGSCRDRINGYHCVCKDGFTGINCDLIFDPCLGLRCFNGGVCYKKGFLNAGCACPANYTGYRCEIQQNLCYGIHCQNGGQCVVYSHDKAKCFCETRWTGELCQFVKQDVCSSQPCPSGSICKSNIDNYICICPKDLKGDNCEQLKLSAAYPEIKSVASESNKCSMCLSNNIFIFLTLYYVFWWQLCND